MQLGGARVLSVVPVRSYTSRPRISPTLLGVLERIPDEASQDGRLSLKCGSGAIV